MFWVVAAGFCCALAIWFLRPHPTLESVGRRAIECTVKGDGNCLYELTTASERDAYNLTPEKMNRFVQYFVSPHMKVARLGGYSTQGSPNVSGNLGVYQEAFFTNGRKLSLGSYVITTDDGPKCPNIVTTLWLTVADLRRKDSRPLRGADRIRWLREVAIADESRLRELGIDGFYEDTERGLILWDDWIAECEGRIKRLSKTSQ